MANHLQQFMFEALHRVRAAQKAVPLSKLEAAPLYTRTPYSLRQALLEAPVGIIAEYKRASPSKGDIAAPELTNTVAAYQEGGACAISVLTEPVHFKGKPSDLHTVRACVDIPILRKDFMVDTYQISEAKAWGADAILLIAAELDDRQIADMADYAHALGLEVLLELHDVADCAPELWRKADVIGVNNRNLKTLAVSLAAAEAMIQSLPKNSVKIAESGIESAPSLARMMACGYQGALVGEALMRSANPEATLREWCA